MGQLAVDREVITLEQDLSLKDQYFTTEFLPLIFRRMQVSECHTIDELRTAYQVAMATFSAAMQQRVKIFAEEQQSSPEAQDMATLMLPLVSDIQPDDTIQLFKYRLEMKSDSGQSIEFYAADSLKKLINSENSDEFVSHRKAGWALLIIKDDEIYVDNYQRCKKQHSSISHGDYVQFAGEIKFTDLGNGKKKIFGITNYSGHYQPDVERTKKALKFLQAQGHDISECVVYLADDACFNSMLAIKASISGNNQGAISILQTMINLLDEGLLTSVKVSANDLLDGVEIPQKNLIADDKLIELVSYLADIASNDDAENIFKFNQQHVFILYSYLKNNDYPIDSLSLQNIYNLLYVMLVDNENYRERLLVSMGNCQNSIAFDGFDAVGVKRFAVEDKSGKTVAEQMDEYANGVAQSIAAFDIDGLLVNLSEENPDQERLLVSIAELVSLAEMRFALNKNCQGKVTVCSAADRMGELYDIFQGKSITKAQLEKLVQLMDSLTEQQRSSDIQNCSNLRSALVEVYREQVRPGVVKSLQEAAAAFQAEDAKTGAQVTQAVDNWVGNDEFFDEKTVKFVTETAEILTADFVGLSAMPMILALESLEANLHVTRPLNSADKMRRYDLKIAQLSNQQTDIQYRKQSAAILNKQLESDYEDKFADRAKILTTLSKNIDNQKVYLKQSSGFVPSFKRFFSSNKRKEHAENKTKFAGIIAKQEEKLSQTTNELNAIGSRWSKVRAFVTCQAAVDKKVEQALAPTPKPDYMKSGSLRSGYRLGCDAERPSKSPQEVSGYTHLGMGTAFG